MDTKKCTYSVVDTNNLTRKEVNKLCRICLTKGDKMIPIESLLSENEGSLSIIKAIEQVMSQKLIVNEEYPSTICFMCKSLLKIAHDLHSLFFNSQSALNKIFKDAPTVDKNEAPTETPVELIYGDNKFSLNDVLIVEGENEGVGNTFQGFLENLGSVVSATFVNKEKKKSGKNSIKKNVKQNRRSKETPNVKISMSNGHEFDLKLYGLQEQSSHKTESIKNSTAQDKDDKHAQGIEKNTDSIQHKQLDISEEISSNDLLGIQDVQIYDASIPSDQHEFDLMLYGLEEVSDINTLHVNQNNNQSNNTTPNVKNVVKQNKINKKKCFRKPANKDVSEEPSSYGIGYQDVEIQLSVKATTLDNSNKVYSCPFCSTQCLTKKVLGDHMKMCKFKSNIFICTTCGTKNYVESNDEGKSFSLFSCKQCNSDVFKTALDNESRAVEVPQYLCDICGHISKSRCRATYHRQTHFERRFECEICHKKFHYKENLKVHFNSHKNIRDHLCTICGKTFYYGNALVYHMRMHTNDRKFVCQFCNRKFYMMSALKRHIRTHTDDRPYSCQFCEKAFRSNGEKRNHEMLHTGERPYQCRFCEKTFISTYNRLVHHMSHSGPHACDFCTRTFMDLEFLKRHVKAKHNFVQEVTEEVILEDNVVNIYE